MGIESRRWEPPLKSTIKEKKDAYWQTRGSQSALICISCSICKSPVAIYQKDGRPNQDLIRTYVDRFVYPPELVNLRETKSLSELPDLKCGSLNDQGEVCNSLIGSRMLYTKNGENRLALRLIQGNFVKTKYMDAEEQQKPKLNRRDKKRKKYL